MAQSDAQPTSSQRVPIIVKEPLDDDQDSTYVFSRLDMGLIAQAEGAAPEPAPEAVEEEKPPVYLPFTDEDEQTLIERPAFLNELHDTITTVRKSTPPSSGKE